MNIKEVLARAGLPEPDPWRVDAIGYNAKELAAFAKERKRLDAIEKKSRDDDED